MIWKSLFDYLLAIILALLTGWMIILLVIIMSIELGSFGWFSQVRIGKDGRRFQFYKIRTMYLPGTSYVSKSGDANISKIGRHLRRYKLDELPQLINVLKGDMSFVGPRPDVPGFADCLEGEYKVILSVKPGITGPSSIKFRNEEFLLSRQPDPENYNKKILWPEKLKINKEYIKTRSFSKDLFYLYKTVFP